MGPCRLTMPPPHAHHSTSPHPLSYRLTPLSSLTPRVPHSCFLVGMSVLLSWLNYRGLTVVGHAVITSTIAIVLPFVLLCLLCIPHIKVRVRCKRRWAVQPMLPRLRARSRGREADYHTERPKVTEQGFVGACTGEWGVPAAVPYCGRDGA